MYGKREQEMAKEVMLVWQWILCIPPSATSKALELAMQAWISLVSGDGGFSVSLSSLTSSSTDLIMTV